MSTIPTEQFTKALLALLDETYDHVNGFYLDRGTSFFETLADITAAEASIPVGGKCATLAAQVKHTAFYLDMLEQGVRENSFPKVDWGEIWRTVSAVTPAEWTTIQEGLRASQQRIVALVHDTPTWGENEIGGAIAMIAHTAYHLGEVRQALCTLRP
jgi:hypothetical protein